MKVETKAGLLASALRNLVPVIERRTSLPLLSCVLFDGNTVRGTDLDVDLSITIPASAATGKIAIDHRSLLNLVRNIPADDTVRVEGGREGATLTFSSGRYDLPALPAGDFPQLSSGATKRVEFDGDGLKKALAFAAPFISTEETRYYLNGVCLDGDLAVATDGVRLGCAPMGAGSFERIIIPRKPVMLMAGLPAAKSLEMSDDRPFMRLRFDGAVLSTKLIDATYPDWRRIVPLEEKYSSKIVFDRTELVSALRRAAAVMTGRKPYGTLAWIDGRVSLVGRSHDTGTAREYLASARCEGSGVISFNMRYVVDALNAFRSFETVSVSVVDADTPATFRGDGDALALLMPAGVGETDFAFETVSKWASTCVAENAA